MYFCHIQTAARVQRVCHCLGTRCTQILHPPDISQNASHALANTTEKNVFNQRGVSQPARRARHFHK